MKGQMPKIKIILIGILIFLAIIGSISIWNFLFPPKIDMTPIIRGQTDTNAALSTIAAEVTSIKSDTNLLKSSSVTQNDIKNLNDKISSVENKIANIQVQTIQNIDLTNINTYMNNYNILLIIDMTIALISITILKLILLKASNKFSYRKKAMDTKIPTS